MQNPFGSQQVPGSYAGLQKRMLQRVQDAKVGERILEIMMKAYEDALYKENIVLSRAERNRLFLQSLKSVFEEILKKYDKPPADTQRE